MRSLGVNPISLPDFTPLTRYVLTYIFRKGARAKWTHVRLTLMDRPGGLPGLYSRLRLKNPSLRSHYFNIHMYV